MDRLDPAVLCRILALVPFSKTKVASQLVCQAWQELLLTKEAHEPSEDDEAVDANQPLGWQCGLQSALSALKVCSKLTSKPRNACASSCNNPDSPVVCR